MSTQGDSKGRDQGATVEGEREFYILSLKHTRPGDRLATWWRPDNKGYCWDLRQAGRYSDKRVCADLFYYNSGCGTIAIPCDAVDAKARQVTFDYDCEPRTFIGVRNHAAVLRKLIRSAPFPFDRPQYTEARWRRVVLPSSSRTVATPINAVQQESGR